MKATELSASTITVPACTATALIAWLYILANGARVFTYIPQLLAVWHSEDGARDLSLLTWSSWVVSNATAVAYGALVINDLSFTLIALLNMVCCAAVTLVGADRRGLFRWHGNRTTLLRAVENRRPVAVMHPMLRIACTMHHQVRRHLGVAPCFPFTRCA